MRNYVICCEKCLEDIARINALSGRLWLDLCKIQTLSSKPIILETPDSTAFQDLETRGYILTTDHEDKMVIRVLGHTLADNGEYFFCVKRGDHD